MNPRHWQHTEEATLQADVMRFMAIVAFCLIAILAMVKQSSSEVEKPGISAGLTQLQPQPQPQTQENSTAAAATDIQTKSTPAPEHGIEHTPEEITHPPEKRAWVSTPATTLEPTQQLQQEKEQEQEQEQVNLPAPSPTSNPSQGLSLRFASEQDFLRLIGAAAIQLYVFTDDKFWLFSTSSRFQLAQPPQQIYELEHQTIPQQMINLSRQQIESRQLLKWGVVLPEKIERQIQSYLGAVEAGQLLINRYQEVSHVAQAN